LTANAVRWSGKGKGRGSLPAVAALAALLGCRRSHSALDGSVPPRVDDGTSQSTPCDPKSCPEGCCGSGDACRQGTNDHECGGGGASCLDCTVSGSSCVGRSCVPPRGCGPSNCTGCCQGNVCMDGTNPQACGADGGMCQNCGVRHGMCFRPARHPENTRCNYGHP
jgi:hypothetical protein